MYAFMNGTHFNLYRIQSSSHIYNKLSDSGYILIALHARMELTIQYKSIFILGNQLLQV